MADSDPISGSSTPNKRRKLDDGHGEAKPWDSQDDSGEEFTVKDLHTVATMPLGTQQKLQYSSEQFHSDIRTNNQSIGVQASSQPRTFMTQPTQTLRISSPSPTPDILVDRSSPPAASSSLRPPQPIRRAFAKPSHNGFLASAIAPPGTSFRAPPGIQSKPKPVEIDGESDEDPPVNHSSDEEQTQGLRSNLKPTNFKKGGRHLDSTPNRSIVEESPQAPPALDTFKGILSEFAYSSPSTKPPDDMISAYGSSRRPKSQQDSKPSSARAPSNAIIYKNIDDIDDYVLRKKVLQIRNDFPWESVQRCMDALKRRHGNVSDAKEWLTADEEQDAIAENDDVDELATESPVAKQGVAQIKSLQSVRPAAKQEVRGPTQTIAERYASTQAGRRASRTEDSPDEVAKPRRRLQQGRKSARSSPTPPSSPSQKQAQLQPLRKPRGTVLEDDSEPEVADESGLVSGDDEAELGQAESTHDCRLLKFFNDCSADDIMDLSAQPEEVVRFVLDRRPFSSLDFIRSISNVTDTKSGRKSKTRPVGDKIVEICSEMLTGYDAVDELVEECERIAIPLQETLKKWGVGVASNDGELQLMNLDHDSGVGTPVSSCSGDEIPGPSSKRGYLSQPSSMSDDFTLKDYQLVGLNWLTLLWYKRLSCILADEMGLGKTCQVIAFLAHLQELEVNGVHLVIVPGSTLENWLREFKQFAPMLKVVPYYGPQAERIALQQHIESEFNSIDVIVTTIDMAVKPDDNRFLRQQVDPLVCVLDEAHALRNRHSDRYRQLSRIRADFRILLTGTPLQNNLQELMAILAFIMPGLFKEKEDDLRFIFQHKASTKDVHNAALLSSQRIARARAMMTPFILRRKKKQVLDLPAKHNRTEYCDMTTSQESYYSSLVQEFHELFANANSRRPNGPGNSSNMLMALRKAAIHPLLTRRLYDDKKIDKIVTELLRHPEFAENERQRVRDYLVGDHYQSFKGGDYGIHRFCHERNYLRKFELKKAQWMDSGKVAKFQELVQAFAANGDRVLVFSQFTTMMDVLEAVLETLGIRFMRLDGSTDMQIRQDMIDKFAEDESITVFMLSTKAGGAGINLACANKVIIFDSGFNPQDDIQAENRAHRVGQTREVEVIRLVTRGTIEEQIQALGESKLELGERVAEGATAAEEKQAEKTGEQIVAKMFLESLKKEDQVGGEEVKRTKESTTGIDLKDAFKSGLENAGVRVSSKQAQF